MPNAITVLLYLVLQTYKNVFHFTILRDWLRVEKENNIE